MFEYPWPIPPNHRIRPIWTGTGFRLGEISQPILSFEVGVSGWSDDLTAFHESAAGADHFIDLASRRQAIRQLKETSHLSSPVILEVGCSSGFMLKDLKRHLPHAFLMGADYVSAPLLKLAQELPDIPLLQFDLTKCPLPDQSVDAVILLNVLEHIEDDLQAMSQVFRILKPGGVTIMEAPFGPHLFDVYDQLLMHYRRYACRELNSLARNAGFKILRHSHLGFFLYPGFWWVKKRNRRFFPQKDSLQRQVVSQDIHQTRNRMLLKWIIELELALGGWISYPLGIRCLVTCARGQS